MRLGADPEVTSDATVGIALVDVVLPCLDEAAALPAVLAGLPEHYRAIVVDNGSTDGSAQVATELGATVVEEPRRGYGAACHAGLLAATADVVAFADADDSLDLGALTMLAERVLDGTADLALGRRRPIGANPWPWHSRLANRFLSGYVRQVSGAQLHDIPPMRVARRVPLLELDVSDRGCGYPLQTVLFAARAGWRVSELPVDYRERVGRSKVTGTVGGTLRAVRDMSAVLRADRSRT
jgi:glycosyltransferase involved in cell wall biosynthesis